MSTPTRLPSGVSTAEKDDAFGMFVMPDPTKVHTFFKDFDTYLATDWTITTVELGAGDATEALADADNGILVITNDANDNDSDFLQWATETFKMAAGKKAWFKARFKVSDATQSDFVMGLQITDTTPLAVTDGIYFLKDDGDAALDFYCRKDATTGSNADTAIHTVVDDTYLTVAWYYDGKSSVKAFVDDAHVSTLDASSTYLPDTELTISFGIQNGEAVAKVMSVDYIFAAKER